jgi:hypothetical protein
MNKPQPKDARLIGILELYDLHTDLFPRALEGISDDDAHQRLGTAANHVAWLAGSIVESRYVAARKMGLDVQQQAHELFSDFKGIQADLKYPPLQQYLEDWNRISPLLRGKTLDADTGWLNEEKDMGDWKASNWELIKFSTYREANMIGQIALWRRLLGYPAMRYM